MEFPVVFEFVFFSAFVAGNERKFNSRGCAVCSTSARIQFFFPTEIAFHSSIAAEFSNGLQEIVVQKKKKCNFWSKLTRQHQMLHSRSVDRALHPVKRPVDSMVRRRRGSPLVEQQHRLARLTLRHSLTLWIAELGHRRPPLEYSHTIAPNRCEWKLPLCATLCSVSLAISIESNCTFIGD